jgi:hypothetical protein
MNGAASPKDNGGRRVAKRLVEGRRTLRHRPGDEPAADPLIPRCGKFAVEPLCFGVAAADEAEPACRADRRRERTARNKSHRRQQHWMPDAELLGQSCAQGHSPLLDQSASRVGYWHR